MKKLRIYTYLVNALLIAILITSVSSCRNSILNKKDTIKADKELDGTIKKYFSAGGIKAIENYKGGILDGWQYVFYPNGQLREKDSFSMGHQEGVGLSYYNNGNLESKINYLNGVQFGSATYYYKNGKIRLYNFYDFYQRNLYVKKFDSTGEIIKEEGFVFVDSLRFRSDTLNSRTYIDFIILAPEPPNESTKIVINEITNNKYSPIDEIKVKNGIGRYTLEYNNSMDKLAVIGTKIDSLTNKNKTLIHIHEK